MPHTVLPSVLPHDEEFGIAVVFVQKFFCRLDDVLIIRPRKALIRRDDEAPHRPFGELPFEGIEVTVLHFGVRAEDALDLDGAVKSYEKEAPTGRTRKYYHVTKKGLRLLDEKKEEWTEFSKTVNAILAGAAPALA